MNKLILVLILLVLQLNANIIQKANKKFIMGNFKKAAKYMPKACDKNDANSCYLAGYLYVNGVGITQDIKKGIEFYKKACTLGDKKSCKYYKKYSKKTME